LTRLIRSLALMTVIKNLGRHTFPRTEGPITHPSSTYITLLYDASSQQTATASGSGGEYGCGPEFWEEQDPEFKGEFPILQKRDFRSMCEVRSYAPNKLVLWPTCSHGERCVMQVYEGWGNYSRRFWHCPLARVSYGNDICSSTMLGLLTFFWEFSSSPTMMTIVAYRNGWIPQPLTPIRITSTTSTTRHLQPAAAPGRSTCFPRSSRRQPVLPLCDLHL
jgi:hypothetical protein